MQLEEALQWVSGPLIGDGWCNSTVWSSLDREAKKKKKQTKKSIREALAPAATEQDKKKKKTEKKPKKPALAALPESQIPESAVIDAQTAMDPAWHKTGHHWLGKPMMRIEYTEEQVFKGYVIGEVAVQCVLLKEGCR